MNCSGDCSNCIYSALCDAINYDDYIDIDD